MIGRPSSPLAAALLTCFALTGCKDSLPEGTKCDAALAAKLEQYLKTLCRQGAFEVIVDTPLPPRLARVELPPDPHFRYLVEPVIVLKTAGAELDGTPFEPDKLLEALSTRATEQMRRPFSQLSLVVAADVPVARVARVLDVIAKDYPYVKLVFEPTIAAEVLPTLPGQAQIDALRGELAQDHVLVTAEERVKALERGDETKTRQLSRKTTDDCPLVSEVYAGLVDFSPDRRCLDQLARKLPEALLACDCDLDFVTLVAIAHNVARKPHRILAVARSVELDRAAPVPVRFAPDARWDDIAAAVVRADPKAFWLAPSRSLQSTPKTPRL